MKNFAFVVSLVALALCTSKNAGAEDLFPPAKETYDSIFGKATPTEPLFKDPTNQAPPSPQPTSPTLPTIVKAGESPTSSDTKDDSGDTDEEEGSEAQGDEIEVPGGQSIFPEEVKGIVARCAEYSPLFANLIGQFCKPDTKIKPTTICGVWLREGRPRMCLGGTRGERCIPSRAGAEGPFQCIPSTARRFGNASYNPQSLEESATCGVHYLCDLEKSVGEEKMFMAYQSGPGGDFSRKNPQVYNQTVREMIAVFEGAAGIDSSNGNSSQVGVPPIDAGLAYISSVVGAFRASHPDIPHQGQDWAAQPGTPVKASFNAKMVIAGWTGTPAGKRCGGQVAYTMGNGEVGSLGMIRGCHLSEVTVSPGQKVTAGQVIGKVGTPGDGKSGVNSSGAHYHWETHIVVSRTVVGGRIIVKTMAFAIMARWFDFSPYVAGTPQQNPRYKGPTTPDVLSKTAKFWKKP